ncbi:DSBA-like thioredoxin domain containing protein [Aureococcus anophagefferens]|nr:DSBA-like thioredoxin domain containing protein [Aureococcus anophagefferens]
MSAAVAKGTKLTVEVYSDMPSGEDYKAYNRRRWGGDGWTRSLRAKGRAVGALRELADVAARCAAPADDVRATKEHELKERLFEAVYERGENISDLETLCRIAGDAGLDTAGFRWVMVPSWCLYLSTNRTFAGSLA